MWKREGKQRRLGKGAEFNWLWWQNYPEMREWSWVDNGKRECSDKPETCKFTLAIITNYNENIETKSFKKFNK